MRSNARACAIGGAHLRESGARLLTLLRRDETARFGSPWSARPDPSNLQLWRRHKGPAQPDSHSHVSPVTVHQRHPIAVLANAHENALGRGWQPHRGALLQLGVQLDASPAP